MPVGWQDQRTRLNPPWKLSCRHPAWMQWFQDGHAAVFRSSVGWLTAIGVDFVSIFVCNFYTNDYKKYT